MLLMIITIATFIHLQLLFMSISSISLYIISLSPIVLCLKFYGLQMCNVYVHLMNTVDHHSGKHLAYACVHMYTYNNFMCVAVSPNADAYG